MVQSWYDPQVEFLEAGVTVNGAFTLKTYGPDADGVYGGMQGMGGLETMLPSGQVHSTGVVQDYFGNALAAVQTEQSSGLQPASAVMVGAGLPNSSLSLNVGLEQSLGWRGKRVDETGLIYLGARHYDPVAGRFLNADPLGHGASMDLYSYCGGDPVNDFDPDGRFGKAVRYDAGIAWDTTKGTVVDIARMLDTIDALKNPGNPRFMEVHQQLALQGAIDYANGGKGWTGVKNAFNRYNPERPAFEALSGMHIMEGPQLGTDLTGQEKAVAWASTISLVASVGAGGPGTIKAVTTDLRALSTAEVTSTEALGTAAKMPVTVDRIRNVAQQGYDYAVQNPRVQGLNRMQLGTDAEVQATRWMRRWAEQNDVNLGPGGLQFQVRGANSVPDVVFDPARQIFDFKLTPRAVRPSQTQNFGTDFPGYNIEYIFGP